MDDITSRRRLTPFASQGIPEYRTPVLQTNKPTSKKSTRSRSALTVRSVTDLNTRSRSSPPLVVLKQKYTYSKHRVSKSDILFESLLSGGRKQDNVSVGERHDRVTYGDKTKSSTEAASPSLVKSGESGLEQCKKSHLMGSAVQHKRNVVDIIDLEVNQKSVTDEKRLSRSDTENPYSYHTSRKFREHDGSDIKQRKRSLTHPLETQQKVSNSSAQQLCHTPKIFSSSKKCGIHNMDDITSRRRLTPFASQRIPKYRTPVLVHQTSQPTSKKSTRSRHSALTVRNVADLNTRPRASTDDTPEQKPNRKSTSTIYFPKDDILQIQPHGHRSRRSLHAPTDLYDISVDENEDTVERCASPDISAIPGGHKKQKLQLGKLDNPVYSKITEIKKKCSQAVHQSLAEEEYDGSFWNPELSSSSQRNSRAATVRTRGSGSGARSDHSPSDSTSNVNLSTKAVKGCLLARKQKPFTERRILHLSSYSDATLQYLSSYSDASKTTPRHKYVSRSHASRSPSKLNTSRSVPRDCRANLEEQEQRISTRETLSASRKANKLLQSVSSKNLSASVPHNSAKSASLSYNIFSYESKDTHGASRIATDSDVEEIGAYKNEPVFEDTTQGLEPSESVSSHWKSASRASRRAVKSLPPSSYKIVNPPGIDMYASPWIVLDASDQLPHQTKTKMAVKSSRKTSDSSKTSEVECLTSPTLYTTKSSVSDPVHKRMHSTAIHDDNVTMMETIQENSPRYLGDMSSEVAHQGMIFSRRKISHIPKVSEMHEESLKSVAVSRKDRPSAQILEQFICPTLPAKPRIKATARMSCKYK